MFSFGVMVHRTLVGKIHTQANEVKNRSGNGEFQMTPNSRQKSLKLGRVGLEARRRCQPTSRTITWYHTTPEMAIRHLPTASGRYAPPLLGDMPFPVLRGPPSSSLCSSLREDSVEKLSF